MRTVCGSIGRKKVKHRDTGDGCVDADLCLLFGRCGGARNRFSGPFAEPLAAEYGDGFAGPFEGHAARIDHQIVAVRIAPPFAGIVFVVGPPVAVHATDFGIGLRLRNAVLGDTAPPRIVGIRAAEDAHEAGIVER